MSVPRESLSAMGNPYKVFCCQTQIGWEKVEMGSGMGHRPLLALHPCQRLEAASFHVHFCDPDLSPVPLPAVPVRSEPDTGDQE